MSYEYSAREVLADAALHVLGLSAGFIGVIMLLAHVGETHAPDRVLAIWLYGGFLLFALLASAAYHLVPFERTRPWLHKIDHAAIYFKIAGTYTPLVVVIGSAFAYGVLALIWLVALAGAVAKLSFWPANARGSLLLYLAMGWACLLLAYPMVITLPPITLILIVLGGLTYTAGTVFFARPPFAYQNAVWHGFVLSASSCFFAAIAMAIST